MSTKARTATKVDPLKKKVPQNPKYKNVQPVVDSGASVNKYMRRLAEISENYRYRKDEIFKRIKVTTFAQLVLQVADLERDVSDAQVFEVDPELDGAMENDNEPDTEIANLSRDGDASERTLREASASVTPSRAGEADGVADSTRSRSSLQSVISGLGELDIKRGQGNAAGARGAHRDHNATSEPWWKADGTEAGDNGAVDTRRSISTAITDENRNDASARSKSSVSTACLASPYLLLDVRDRDEYDAAHIRSAISYPIAMLSRSVNAEIPEMRAFRNEPGRIIIVYDADETIAPRVASTLVQRGYDNLFMLSGGLRVTRKFFPDGLILVRSREELQSLPQTQTGTSEFDAESVDKVRAALEAQMLRGTGASSSARSNSRASVASSAGSRPGTRSTAPPSRMMTASSTASVRSTYK